CAVWDLPPTASVTNIASYPAFQCLHRRERQANLGVESTEDQPLAPGLLYGFPEGAILERVHRPAVDHLYAGKLGEERRGRRPIDAGRDADGGQHDRQVERLGGPGQEANVELRQGGARFRANGGKYLRLIVDQHQGAVLMGPDTEISVHRSSRGGRVRIADARWFPRYRRCPRETGGSEFC